MKKNNRIKKIISYSKSVFFATHGTIMSVDYFSYQLFRSSIRNDKNDEKIVIYTLFLVVKASEAR
jgi:hypothetical protein